MPFAPPLHNSCVSKKSNVGYFAILVIAQIVVSAGATPLLSLTSTYMQENVDKHTLGMYLGVFQGAPGVCACVRQCVCHECV